MQDATRSYKKLENLLGVVTELPRRCDANIFVVLFYLWAVAGCGTCIKGVFGGCPYC